MGVDVPGAFPASNFADFADATGPPALDYSLAINLITVSNQLGGIFSNYLAGLASDKVGRKIVIQGCLLGGVVSYLLMFAAGVWSPNYWFFLAGNFVNGLFSGSRGVIQAYLQVGRPSADPRQTLDNPARPPGPSAPYSAAAAP